MIDPLEGAVNAPTPTQDGPDTTAGSAPVTPLLASYRCLEKQDPATQQRWFCALSVQPTLFGDWSLIRESGRLGAPSQVEVERYASQEAAEAAFAQRVCEIRQGGYA
jgi:predicted DNA-binding WGR domain protein